MEVLGDKIIRDSQFAIIRVKNRIFKIPFSRAAYQELRAEKKVLPKVKEDNHFSEYLSNCKFYTFFSITPYFKSIEEHPLKDSLLKKYFQKALADSRNWKLVSLKSIDDCNYFLEFIKKYFFKDYQAWDYFLSNIVVQQSSAHGDFYLDNILIKDDKLFFIDWDHYNSNSSRFFDLVNFYIFSKREGGQSWTEVWQKNYPFNQESVLGIKVDKNYFLAYGPWKVGKELKMLKRRHGLTAYKIKKYINFVNSFIKMVDLNNK